MLLIKVAIALTIYVEYHVSGTVTAASQALPIHAVTVDGTLGDLAEEILLCSCLSSEKLKGHLTHKLGAAGQHNGAHNSFALSDNDVGSVSITAEPVQAIMGTKSVTFLSSILEAVKLDGVNSSTLVGRHNNSAHLITLLFNGANSLAALLDVVSVVFSKNEAGCGVGTVSELDFLF